MPISDIVACSEREFSDRISSENAWKGGAIFSNKIGCIEFSQLGEMLGVGSYDQLFKQFKMVGPHMESMWGETTPPHLMDKLRTLDDKEVKIIALSWSKIEEFYGQWEPSVLEEHLLSLRAFLEENSGPYFLINTV